MFMFIFIKIAIDFSWSNGGENSGYCRVCDWNFISMLKLFLAPKPETGRKRIHLFHHRCHAVHSVSPKLCPISQKGSKILLLLIAGCFRVFLMLIFYFYTATFFGHSFSQTTQGCDPQGIGSQNISHQQQSF